MELLRILADQSKRPGRRLLILEDDYPLAWAEDSEELRFHLAALSSKKLVVVYNSPTKRALGEVELTADGWDFVEKGPATVLPRAFVAMSFAAELLPTWNEGIKPGIEAAGYTAHRVDSERHVDKIDQKIIADIRTSKFVVADVTGQRPGVYFEAGFAQGLGKTVIWSVRKDEIEKVHFDTRQFAHIVWSDHAHFVDELQATIVAILGAGPKQSR